MLGCRYLPVWINVTGRHFENKGKLKKLFIGQFYSLQWLVRKLEGRVWYSEKRITGEVSISTVKFRIERIPKLVRSYKLEDISNMDNFGLFFELLPDKGLIEKAKN